MKIGGDDVGGGSPVGGLEHGAVGRAGPAQDVVGADDVDPSGPEQGDAVAGAHDRDAVGDDNGCVTPPGAQEGVERG